MGFLLEAEQLMALVLLVGRLHAHLHVDAAGVLEPAGHVGVDVAGMDQALERHVDLSPVLAAGTSGATPCRW